MAFKRDGVAEILLEMKTALYWTYLQLEDIELGLATACVQVDHVILSADVLV